MKLALLANLFADDAIFIVFGVFFASTTAPHRGNAILFLLSILPILSKNSNAISRGICFHEFRKVGGVGNPALPVGTWRFHAGGDCNAPAGNRTQI
jgi:hypothetical protein